MGRKKSIFVLPNQDLKNLENLTKTQLKTLKTIESIPRLNLKTVRAYHIRENFQNIYKEETGEGFTRALKNDISEQPIAVLTRGVIK